MLKSLFAWVARLSLLTLAPLALAQQAGVPPLIRIVVPFGPGSSTDIVARSMATQLATRLGTTVVVENRAGGSTMIGAGAVANGPRDGSMILVTTPSTISAAATVQRPPFDMNKDLMPIAIIGEGPMMLAASANSGIRTPADIVSKARAKPDGITYGTSGVGSLPHLSTEMFADAAKIQLKHIPYKGGAFAVVDLSGGTIDLMLGTYATFAPHIKAGRVFPVGISSRDPSPAYPGLSTMGAVAPGYAGSVWIAAFAQAGTPAQFSQRLNREINEIATSKQIRDVLEADGSAPVAMPLDALRERMQSDYSSWKKLATEKKIIITE